MSRKQEIYRDILCRSLPLIRNCQTQSIWKKAIDKTSYYESELVHNLCVSILEESFTEHDIHFLNHQAKWYLRECSLSASPNYAYIKQAIDELNALVPLSLRDKLDSSG